jgi:hypothetical protein
VIQIDAVAAAGDVGVAMVIQTVGTRLEGVVARVVKPLEESMGPSKPDSAVWL